jgi:DGQHR domain-containing protein
MAQKRKRRRAKRRPPDPQVLEQRAQRKSIRDLFRRSGFDRIDIENVHFTFEGRTGELDDIYVYENLIVATEYTTASDCSGHLFGKKTLFDNINGKPSQWIQEFSGLCPDLQAHIGKHPFSNTQYQVRILYVAKNLPSTEATTACRNVLVLGPREIRYFLALTKTIEQSARFELFKFLRIEPTKIGERALTASSPVKSFAGFLLPESFSSFPPGFRLVSFYADPETLLETCFVLRKDSWDDPESLYQRMLMPKKIRNMRRYLSGNQRVFVNNIIVSLPLETALNDSRNKLKNLAESDLNEIQPVTIHLPHTFNSVGVIDGQHRIFCYHEGRDTYDKKISPLRKTQHLLVTGIVYPPTLSEERRRKFEAQLFLEINDEQTKAKSDLKQAIALLLRPTSTVAICKAIIYRLAERGPLKDLLEVHFFDDKNKLKTTSIVSYGLIPLVKFEGDDTLFKLWSHTDKDELAKRNRVSYPQEALRSYIEFCTDQINELLIAAKLSIGPANWKTQAEGGLLSPTLINGFIVCLRELVAHKKAKGQKYYQRQLQNIEKFKFQDYKSSHWKRLGKNLAETHFGIAMAE